MAARGGPTRGGLAGGGLGEGGGYVGVEEGAVGYREFGLFGDRGGDAEAGVQAAGDQGDAAGAADEEDAGQGVRADAGPLQDAAGLVDGPGDEGAGDAVEFLAGQVQGVVAARYLDRGAGGAGQHLLGGADLVPEDPAVAEFGGGGRGGQAAPGGRVAQFEELAHVADEGRVDVEAAEVVETAGGQDRQAGRFALHDGDVQGAAAEVEDGEDLADADAMAEHVQAVRGGGDRLLDQVDVAEPGPPGGFPQDVAPGGAPVRRAGQHRTAGRVGAGVRRLDGDPLEDGGEQVGDRHLGLAEQHAALVHAPLGVGLEAFGGDLGEAFGVAAGLGGAVRVDVHARGQQWRPVEEQGPYRLVVTPHHSDRVRRAEVDRQPHVCLPNRAEDGDATPPKPALLSRGPAAVRADVRCPAETPRTGRGRASSMVDGGRAAA